MAGLGIQAARLGKKACTIPATNKDLDNILDTGEIRILSSMQSIRQEIAELETELAEVEAELEEYLKELDL